MSKKKQSIRTNHTFVSSARFSVLLLAIFLANYVGFAKLSSSEVFSRLLSLMRSSEPRLEGPTEVVNLGQGKPHEVLSGIVEFKNSGTADLEFQLSASCGCTEVEPRSGTISPGKSQAVRVSVRLPGYGNSERTVRLTVTSNDPNRPTAEYGVLATSPASVQVSPMTVYFGRIVPAEIDQLERYLTVNDSQGKSIQDESSLRYKSNTKHTILQWKQIESGKYGLCVSLAPGIPQAEFHDIIEISLADTGPSLKVPVYAYVTESVRIVPSTAFLHIQQTSGLFKPVDVLVYSDRPLGTLKNIKGPKEVTVVESKLLRPGIQKIRLAVNESLKSNDNCQVLLAFENYEDPLALKLVLPSSR